MLCKYLLISNTALFGYYLWRRRPYIILFLHFLVHRPSCEDEECIRLSTAGKRTTTQERIRNADLDQWNADGFRDSRTVYTVTQGPTRMGPSLGHLGNWGIVVASIPVSYDFPEEQNQEDIDTEDIT